MYNIYSLGIAGTDAIIIFEDTDESRYSKYLYGNCGGFIHSICKIVLTQHHVGKIFR
jgi:hypothetical protein